MKRLLAMIMVLLMLCQVLWGCNAEQAGSETGGDTTTLPEDGLGPKPVTEGLTLGESGKIRLEYTVNRSSVRYITSASQLPANEELAQFDDAYFQENALLLVYETISSGVEVSIGSIDVNGSNASVTLTKDVQSDVSTAVMTTWLLWVQLERDLDYDWSVSNPALESNISDR